MCGLPLYEYEHMLGWARVREHNADEITLLCDRHHREKTNGLLPIEKVREANSDPYNLRAGVSKPYDLHFSGGECEIEIGSNRFLASFGSEDAFICPVYLDGLAVLGFSLSQGHLLLYLNLFDESGYPVMIIEANRLVYSVSPWDIEFRGRRLVIREASREILTDIVFEVPNKIVISRGRFLYHGMEFLVAPDYAVLANNRNLFSGMVIRNFFAIGFAFGKPPPPASAIYYVDAVPRYIDDPSETRKWVRSALSGLRDVTPRS
jgi:trigger factor